MVSPWLVSSAVRRKLELDLGLQAKQGTLHTPRVAFPNSFCKRGRRERVLRSKMHCSPAKSVEYTEYASVAVLVADT